MKTTTKLGIWMDHSHAHLMDYSRPIVEGKIITSKFDHQVKKESLKNTGEKKMHIKEQHLQAEFYKNLVENIINYKEVIIFGMTDAKAELFNILSEDQRFKNIKIEVIPTDKLSDKQQEEFVRNYFS